MDGCPSEAVSVTFRSHSFGGDSLNLHYVGLSLASRAMQGLSWE